MSSVMHRAEAVRPAIGGGGAMPALAGYCHARAYLAGRRLAARLSAERGQGTVEYVGLILLVSLLMVGMVAAMRGFDGKQGQELAEVIVSKIKQAVNTNRN